MSENVCIHILTIYVRDAHVTAIHSYSIEL